MSRLQLKIFGALAVVALAALVLFGAFGRRVSRSGVNQVIEIEEMRSARSESALAALLARRLEDLAREEGDLRSARALLREAAEDGAVFALVDPQGELLVTTADGFTLFEIRVVPDGVEVNALVETDGRKERLIVRGGVPVVAAGGETLAYLLPLPKGPPAASERRAVLGAVDRGLWWSLAAVLALVVAVSVLLSRRIVRPIEELAGAVREVGAGNLERRVEVAGRDEIARLGQAFNEMTARLARSESLRRQMTADVAHELRTPLTSLIAQLEAVEDGLLPADAETAASLAADARHLGLILDDLQQLVQADAGALSLETAPFPLRPVVEEAARSLGLGGEKGAGIEVEMLEDLAVDADPRRLRQVLDNLFDNLRVHAPGAAVAVAAERRGRWVEVTIRDDGPGIAPEHLPHVLERFYRADPSRTRVTGGSGLGLAIVKTLIELHGGRIAVESTPGAGTEIRFTLPAAG